MLSVKGTFEKGIARPEQPVSGRDGQMVIITFIEDKPLPESTMSEASWDALFQLIDEYAVETGISDFAQEHDHYLHGTPKRAKQNG
jgi:hypothetical protein